MLSLGLIDAINVISVEVDRDLLGGELVHRFIPSKDGVALVDKEVDRLNEC
jgi:hypothetical protein